MPRTFFQDFTTDSGQPITVEYFYERGESVCIKGAWIEPSSPDLMATDVVLTDAENDRMAEWISENRFYSDQE